MPRQEMRVFQAEGRVLAKFLWPWEWEFLEHMRPRNGCSDLRLAAGLLN